MGSLKGSKTREYFHISLQTAELSAIVTMANRHSTVIVFHLYRAMLCILHSRQKTGRDRPGRPRITWMKTVLNDLQSHNLTLTEAVNMAQNRPLWRLLVASGATHALIVVQARNDDDDDDNVMHSIAVV